MPRTVVERGLRLCANLALLTPKCQQRYHKPMTKQKTPKDQQADETLQQQIGELTQDLQRIQADFINYRNRTEEDKRQVAEAAKAASVLKLLPVIDIIERAIQHVPQELADNKWAQGIVGLGKNLDKSLDELGINRIAATPDTPFDPNLHEAVMMDEGDGEQEVVAEELRAGYTINGQVIRPSMVRVARK